MKNEKQTRCKIATTTRLTRNQCRTLESLAEFKMVSDVLTRSGKIRQETQIHNSAFDLVISKGCAEMDSFYYGLQVGAGSGRIYNFKSKGSLN